MSRIMLFSLIFTSFVFSSSAILIENGTKLYMVQYDKVRNAADSMEFCRSIGGVVPEFDPGDESVMEEIADTMLRSGMPYSAMLNGVCRDGDVIRWKSSNRAISNVLWGSGQPENFRECTVFLSTGSSPKTPRGRLFAFSGVGNGNTLCVFELESMSSLSSLMSGMRLLNETDRAAVASKFVCLLEQRISKNDRKSFDDEILRIQNESRGKMSDFERTVFVELKDMRNAIRSMENDAMNQADEIQKQYDHNAAETKDFQQNMSLGLKDVKLMIANLTIEMMRRDEHTRLELLQLERKIMAVGADP